MNVVRVIDSTASKELFNLRVLLIVGEATRLNGVDRFNRDTDVESGLVNLLILRRQVLSRLLQLRSDVEGLILVCS